MTLQVQYQASQIVGGLKKDLPWHRFPCRCSPHKQPWQSGSERYACAALMTRAHVHNCTRALLPSTSISHPKCSLCIPANGSIPNAQSTISRLHAASQELTNLQAKPVDCVVDVGPIDEADKMKWRALLVPVGIFHHLLFVRPGSFPTPPSIATGDPPSIPRKLLTHEYEHAPSCCPSQEFLKRWSHHSKPF